MKDIHITLLAALTTVIVGIAAWNWVLPNPIELQVRQPGMDNRPAGGLKRQGGEITFNFVSFVPPADEIKSESKLYPDPQKHDNWPHFRGPNRDANWNNPDYDVIQNWEETPLECLWSIPVGEGYAGATIYNSVVYMLDYNTEKETDVLRAISLETGKDIWNISYPIKVKRDHGMSRSIPAVSDKYIVTIGPRCHVMCVERLTGKKLWHIDLVAEYGTKVPLWHASQCPLIENDTAIIAPSGSVLMIAVDCATGEVIWQTPNNDKWDMTHSSIMPIDLDGIHMYVYCGDGGICGVNAINGKMLWVNNDWSMRTNVPTPIPVGNGRLFLCAGYNKGCALLEIYRTKDVLNDDSVTEYTAKMVYMKPATIFGAVQHTPVLYDGYIYGIRQDKRLVCLNIDGEIQWESPKNDKYGDSPFMIVNDQLIALDDHGTMSLVELTPSNYNLITRQQVLFGRESWGLMSISNGLLVIRDFTEMRCYKLAESK